MPSRRCSSATCALAELVLSREPLVNDYESRLDRDTLTFIALQQPVASDLRATRAIARVALELERVGDESKKIARFAPRQARPPSTIRWSPWRVTCGTWRPCRRRCCATRCGRSTRRVRSWRARCSARDKELDAEFATALRQLMSFVMEDHQFLRATIDTVFALKGLERIGDHAKNIAEQVLYMVEGERPRKVKKSG